MADYLAHYGRKGMKWGKHIFKSDEQYKERSRDLAGAASDMLLESTDDNIRDELVDSEYIRNSRKEEAAKLRDVISGALGNEAAQRRVNTRHAILEAERGVMGNKNFKSATNRKTQQRRWDAAQETVRKKKAQRFVNNFINLQRHRDAKSIAAGTHSESNTAYGKQYLRDYIRFNGRRRARENLDLRDNKLGVRYHAR